MWIIADQNIYIDTGEYLNLFRNDILKFDLNNSNLRKMSPALVPKSAPILQLDINYITIRIVIINEPEDNTIDTESIITFTGGDSQIARDYNMWLT